MPETRKERIPAELADAKRKRAEDTEFLKDATSADFITNKTQGLQARLQVFVGQLGEAAGGVAFTDVFGAILQGFVQRRPSIFVHIYSYYFGVFHFGTPCKAP